MPRVTLFLYFVEKSRILPQHRKIIKTKLRLLESLSNGIISDTWTRTFENCAERKSSLKSKPFWTREGYGFDWNRNLSLKRLRVSPSITQQLPEQHFEYNSGRSIVKSENRFSRNFNSNVLLSLQPWNWWPRLNFFSLSEKDSTTSRDWFVAKGKHCRCSYTERALSPLEPVTLGLRNDVCLYYINTGAQRCKDGSQLWGHGWFSHSNEWRAPSFVFGQHIWPNPRLDLRIYL